MQNIDHQGFITSGILDMFVLGLTTPEEAKEVEEMAALHPEIQQELDAIREALEHYVLAHGIQPPDGLKYLILQRIESSSKPKHKARPEPENTHPETTVFHSGRERKERGRPNVAAVATWLLGLLFLGSVFAAWHFRQQVESARAETQALRTQFDQFKKESETRQQLDAQLREQFIAIRHWATKPIHLKGTKLSQEAFAVIYWNDVKRSAYLDVINLPEPAADKQYQLWAIVNGKPSDLGVFELKTEDGGLKPVAFIQNAQAYAVTLEPKGGSPQPTFDQMYVVGNAVKG